MDFEDANQKNYFVVPPDSKGDISLSTFASKSGDTSLKLESQVSGTSVFRYERPSSDPIQKTQLWRGGIKMWIYKKDAVKGKKMEVRLLDKAKNVRVGTFIVDMGFKGWRGIWVSYGESREHLKSLSHNAKITQVEFVLDHQDTVYIDLLEFMPTLAFQSRDKIVPPFTKFGSKYDYTNFWQQSYNCSQQTPTALPASIDALKALSIAHIESRLRNWNSDETTTTYDFTGTLQSRWRTLKRSIDYAQEEYDRLEFKTLSDKTVINGPPLFCLRCERGSRVYKATIRPRKFSFVMTRVLQPLAIELHLKSRSNEMKRTVTKETPKLNSPHPNVVKQSLIRVCGLYEARQNEFHNHLKSQGTPYTEDKVHRSLEYINQARLQRILNVLDYLEDQGWADGSAIGSLYMEMLRSGAGFVHSLFLLEDSLERDAAYKNRLINLINTAKWYNDFGDVYQAPFKYKGTTAHKMITMMLFHLLIVLSMPTSTDEDQKALQRWLENALTINQAFGGVIKPDYTGFHHMAFYASAYIPDALHTVAQVQYLLEGMEFALSETAKRNIREGLKTLRMTAVKYSTPGRIPDYCNEVLLKNLPAYAYISVSYPGSLATTPLKGITIPGLNKDAELFERLYQPSDKAVSTNLGRGWIQAGKSYFNSIGSLQLMITVSCQKFLCGIITQTYRLFTGRGVGIAKNCAFDPA